MPKFKMSALNNPKPTKCVLSLGAMTSSGPVLLQESGFHFKLVLKTVSKFVLKCLFFIFLLE